GQRVGRLRHADWPQVHASRAREVQSLDRGRSAQLHGATGHHALHRADTHRRRPRAAPPRPAAVHPVARRPLRDHRRAPPRGAGHGVARGQQLAGRRQQGHLDRRRRGRRLMLSRLADNLYWFGRYLQRAENTARLVNVNTILSMDLPRRVQLGWEPLVDLVGARATFAELYPVNGEESLGRFLPLDERNGGSILCSLHRARESLRTTRDYMPGDVWARVNDLYFYVQDKGERSLGRSRRQEFLDRVMDGALGIHGLLVFNMSHDVGFH